MKHELFRFACFTLDSSQMTLRRGEELVALPRKVFDTLAVLVRHRGEVVTKQYLMETVWPDTFVEEANLTQNIFQLRKKLGRTPEGEEYIQTLPKLGYRLVVPVEEVELDSDEMRQEPPVVTMPKTVPWLWISALLLLVLVTAAVFGLNGRKHPPTTAKAILLGDVSNSTGELVFDGTLRQGLIVQLEQSPFIRLESEQNIQKTLHLMGRSANTALTPAVTREVCQRLGSAAILDGSIVRLGSAYVVSIQATACSNGELLDAQQEQAQRKEDVLQALSEAVARFRAKIGESGKSIQSLNTPLAEATTSSLDALKAYSDANRILNADGSSAALPLLRRSVELDPGFATAHALLGRIYGDLGQDALSAESTAKAYQFRDRTSEPERFFITASEDMQVTGNLERAEETCRNWAEIYPNLSAAEGFRAGVILPVFGRYQEAASLAQRLIKLNPDFAIGYHLAAMNDIALGRLDDAQIVLDTAQAKKLSIPPFWLDRYRIAFLRNDASGLRDVAARAASSPGTQYLLVDMSILLYSGHLAEARKNLVRTVGLAKHAGANAMAARLLAGAATREALLGNRDTAVQAVQDTLDLSHGRDAEYGASFALAMIGNSARAEALADDLEKRFPDDTSMRIHYMPVVRALIALNRNHPQRAIDILQPTTPFELGTAQSGFSGKFGALYSTYVFGQAYLAAHRDAEAVSEFRKILEHPSIVVNDVVGPLTDVQLGRTYAALHMYDKAKAAYGMFFKLWSTADQDIPVFRQAREEYTRLH